VSIHIKPILLRVLSDLLDIIAAFNFHFVTAGQVTLLNFIIQHGSDSDSDFDRLLF